MGFGLVITSGDTLAPMPDGILQWLVEARVELELSKPTRFALRFEDDLCEGKPAVEGAAQIAANVKIGIFVQRPDALECLVFGPVTKVKSSSVLGGSESWIEVHGEDRRIEMGRIGVEAKYIGKASAAASSILSAYQFTPDTQNTLIEYDDQKIQLTQRGTDLAFLEDVARRNNMEFWISYAASRAPADDAITLIQTANLRTSPPRAQSGDTPQVPALVPDAPRVLRVNPPPRDCPSVNKFEARIDYEKPTAAHGFAMTEDEEKKAVDQIVPDPAPVDPEKPVPVSTGVERKAITPPSVTPEEAFLASDAITFEQSWFVEVDCSTTLEQADFVILPHMVVQVAQAGDRLSGAYQVMKATHVVTATDHFMDFTLRANGLGGDT